MDIREHYERKLERANNLYMELSAIMLQLEMREKELIKYVPGPLFVLIDLGLSVGQDVILVQVQSVQFSRSVVSSSLRPYESQHTRPPCPSPTPGAYSNSCLSS